MYRAGFGEIAYLMKCLPCKLKDPELIPRTHLKKLRGKDKGISRARLPVSLA